MSNASWRPLAEQMATGLALVDAELRVAWLNPALAERLALGTRNLFGQPAALMFADDAAVLAQARRALAEERALQLRGVAMTTQRGTEWQADLSLQPFDGQLLLEVHALAQPAAAASPLSASLRGFAHEVKNPLAGLRGAAQLLQRRLDDEDLKALAGMVIAEADRLGALANRLLHHDGAPRLAPVNIHHLLERLEDLLEAEPTPLTLRHDYDQSALVTTVTTERPLEGQAWERFTDSGPVALLPLGDRRAGLVLCVPRAEADGVVKSVNASAGASVAADEVLVEFA